MNIVKTIEEVRKQVKEWRKEGLSIGFVPTMGYLHEGHQSLIREAAENDRVVVSIFVNPMQFGPKEDFQSYPRDFARDCAKCEEAGTDMIFYPEPAEMYTDGFCSYADMHILTEELCGLSRPVHFRGVCTIVLKLFQIVQPDKAYFGQKDAQQLAVIKRMVLDFNIDVEVVGCPIIREEDGLAKSSRNTYLNTEERKAALALSKAIFQGKQMAENSTTDAAEIVEVMKSIIQKEPLAKIDYVKAVDAATITPVEKIDRPVLFAMAVFIGNTRLIDNFITE